MSSLSIELRQFQEMRRNHGVKRGKNTGDNLDGLLSKAIARIEETETLLLELVDIEGPCPGTGDWAVKVRAALVNK